MSLRSQFRSLGQPLARMDDAELTARVDQARARVACGEALVRQTRECGPTSSWGAVADPFRISGSATSLAFVPTHSPPVSFSSAARAWLMHQ